MRVNRIINKIVIITIVIISVFFNVSYAAVTNSPIDTPDYYRPPGINGSQVNRFLPSIQKILGIINVLGTVISVVVIMVIGIKYMLGSVQEKAEYKKTALTYIIGAVLLFSATTIPNIIYNLLV